MAQPIRRSIAVIGLAAVIGACAPSAAVETTTGAKATATASPVAAASAPSGDATPSPASAAVAAKPPQPPQPAPSGPVDGAQGGPAYTVEQAVSDRAQSTTIAFDALGFLTGNLGADSFFPPGKVADFWGFQYLRDNDPTAMGHNTDFLTKVSLTTLNALTTAQRAELVALAKSQVTQVATYAQDRFVLMAAFRRLLDGTLPAGTTGLSEAAVAAYSAKLYQLDGEISIARAMVMGPMIASLSSAQKTSLTALKGVGVADWPTATEPAELGGLDRPVKELVMTYSGDLYAWYAGSVTADTYFCPERHGTYFGSFYLKDAPAVGNAGYAIDTTITANLGAALLGALDATQAAMISDLVPAQRETLAQIVATRQAVSTRLRALQSGGTLDGATTASLMATYGELDGKLVYLYATAFAKVGQTLTSAERTALEGLRTKLLGTLALPTGAYLYSTPIAMPTIPSTDFLFR